MFGLLCFGVLGFFLGVFLVVDFFFQPPRQLFKAVLTLTGIFKISSLESFSESCSYCDVFLSMCLGLI